MTAQLPVQEYKEQEYINKISDISNISEGTLVLQNSQLATQPLLTPASDTQSDLERLGAEMSDFLAELPHHAAWFYSEYKGLFIGFGALVAAVFALRIAVAILSAFNGIPLLKEFFQIVGIGYSVWFVNRYLKSSSKRQELGTKVDAVKESIN
jgi:CAAD domains of cyanobacterial aminoacyl-tRNA synthetase